MKQPKKQFKKDKKPAEKPKNEAPKPPAKAFIVGMPTFDKKKSTNVVVKTPSSVSTPAVPVKENTKVEAKNKSDKKQYQNKTFDKKDKKEGKSSIPPKKVHWWTVEENAEAEELLLTPAQHWHQSYPTFLEEFKYDSKHTIDEKLSTEINNAMSNAYKREIARYQKVMVKHGMSSEKQWLNSIVTSGTWSDKIAALTLRIQESPFHNLEAIDLLIGIGMKKDMRVGLFAVEALKDLCLNNLLPDRTLREWKVQPLLHPEMTVTAGLLLWFEKELKSRIHQMIEILDKVLKSNLVHFRKQALDVVLGLLMKKPEQETRLLLLLVNKLGDSEGVVHSKVSTLLSSLLAKHPVMKQVVINEVRNFLYRPGTKLIAIFHGIMFLLRIRISDEEPKVALTLCECYLSLFEKAQEAKEEGSRLLSALLKGINKTFPLIDNVESLHPYLDAIFRIVHTANSYHTSTQALLLISHMVLTPPKDTFHYGKSTVQEDDDAKAKTAERTALIARFFTTLYDKLLSDQVMSRSNNTLFLNILFRSLKYDKVIPRIMAFIKRIASFALHAPANVAAGLLYMISEIMQAHPELKKMISSAETHVDANANKPTPPSFKKQKAIAETDKKKNNNKNKKTDNSKKQTGADSEEEEEDSEGDDESIGNNTVTTMTDQGTYLLGSYDPMKRNPEYACLGKESQPPVLFELSLFRHHYHPSVRAFANALLQPPEHGINFDGDPLVEFSLMSFLNRFAYKHPKQNVAEALRKHAQSAASQEDPINEQFAKRGMEDYARIAPEKHFFYRYFGEREQLRAEGKSKPRKTKKDGDSDDSEAEEDEMDAFADKLADDLMRHNDATRDFGDDDFEEDDDDDSDGFLMNADSGLEDNDKDQHDDDDEDVVEGDDDHDEEDDEFIEDDEEEEEEVMGKGKKRKVAEVISDALDFEDFKKELSGNKKNTSTSKDSKKKKVVEEVEESDEDDEEIMMPQTYQSDAEDDDIADDEEEEDDMDIDLEEEGMEDFDSDELEDEEGDWEDEDDEDEEEEEVIVPVKKGKGKNVTVPPPKSTIKSENDVSKKGKAGKVEEEKKKSTKQKGKKARIEEEDDDDEDDFDFDEEDFMAVSKGKKGKYSKASKGDSAFADASLYEDEMEENVQAYQLDSVLKSMKALEAKYGKDDVNDDEEEEDEEEVREKGKKGGNQGKNKGKTNQSAKQSQPPQQAHNQKKNNQQQQQSNKNPKKEKNNNNSNNKKPYAPPASNNQKGKKFGKK